MVLSYVAPVAVYVYIIAEWELMVNHKKTLLKAGFLVRPSVRLFISHRNIKIVFNCTAGLDQPCPLAI
jgi:hypothetical protein